MTAKIASAAFARSCFGRERKIVKSSISMRVYTNSKATFLPFSSMKTVLLLCLLLAGCAYPHYDSAPGAAAYPPKPADYVVAVLDRADIKRPYKVVGTVGALGDIWTAEHTLIRSLQLKARRNGADAIIDVHPGVNRMYPELVATAIIYTDYEH